MVSGQDDNKNKTPFDIPHTHLATIDNAFRLIPPMLFVCQQTSSGSQLVVT